MAETSLGTQCTEQLVEVKNILATISDISSVSAENFKCPCLISGGWKGHAVYYVVKESEDGDIELTICNTGPTIPTVHDDVSGQRAKNFAGQIKINKSDLQKALKLIKKASTENTTNALDTIYKDLLALNTDEVLTRTNSKNTQHAPNCGIKGLKLAIAVLLGNEDYKKYCSSKALTY